MLQTETKNGLNLGEMRETLTGVISPGDNRVSANN